MRDRQTPPSPQTVETDNDDDPRPDTRHRSRRRFPGLPSQVKHARRFVARCLGDLPEADTAILLTSEVVTNAVVHSDSGAPGGKFDIAVIVGDGHVRVEVGDSGSSSVPVPQERDAFDIADHGRGLDLVEALSARWGTADRDYGRMVWFELRTQVSGSRGEGPAGSSTT
ncbi:ATP-binding protein [Spiractinospora alimapuensis]|uniref:ATP-binding protein n=1 Tax=Spiractinospora alimapuensis TaxID=2820884 RepID=UPI001F2D7664|nr:ATP-binding protein [Spiractinospora alimapuensis]QVQ51709.1 ATP-binding protein [Spiractinospora alimapuensis]